MFDVRIHLVMIPMGFTTELELHVPTLTNVPPATTTVTSMLLVLTTSVAFLADVTSDTVAAVPRVLILTSALQDPTTATSMPPVRTLSVASHANVTMDTVYQLVQFHIRLHISMVNTVVKQIENT